MPPIMATTCWPSANSPAGADATTPVASMPSTRGKVMPWARPNRVCSSERLIPNALTRMSTQPGRGSGTGSSWIRSTWGGPGASSTTARIVTVMSRLTSLSDGSIPLGAPEYHPDADDHGAPGCDLEQADAQGDVEEASADERDRDELERYGGHRVSALH